ncbi:sodium:alanine symporter family protein [bacterium]|nr:sodium:alanine symporter family protein [bacterium]
MLSAENILLPIVSRINECLSNYILVFLLLGVGIWYSVRTNFVQIRCFGEGIKRTFGNFHLFGKKHEHKMTSFQALATAVAAQVGTGNIVGASGAILIGGPGTIFWMWLIAFFGMATIYAEATLAIKTRITDREGAIKGGPVYYIKSAFNGITGKILANCFAVAIILALGCMGCMVQSNSISYTMQTAFGIQPWIIGIILVSFCSLIFIGGVRRLAAVTEKIVPIMALLFIIGCIVILIARINYIPETFKMIFYYAFHPQSKRGGTFGYGIKAAISQGAKRGLFSNEAGMGSTPHAHALAHVKNPHEQGTVAMVGVFIDTFIILTLNALVIISTLYAGNGPLSGGYKGEIVNVLNNTNLVQVAFGSIFGDKGGSIFVAVCLLFFAFSTILSWNLFGKINATYLARNNNPKATGLIYTIVSLSFIMLGTLISSNFVWELADMFNNLMVIPNALALFALTSTVIAILKNKNENLID